MFYNKKTICNLTDGNSLNINIQKVLSIIRSRSMEVGRNFACKGLSLHPPGSKVTGIPTEP